jgi:anti-sigma factor RsiW
MQAQTTVQNQFFDTITDQDFSDAVAVHEQDLIDAYALGSLTPEEARSIQTWIEASPRRMQRVGMARALLVRHPQKIRRNPWINDVRNDVSLSRMR